MVLLFFKCCPLGSASYTCTADGACLSSGVSIATERFTRKSLVIGAVMQAGEAGHTDLRLQHASEPLPLRQAVHEWPLPFVQTLLTFWKLFSELTPPPSKLQFRDQYFTWGGASATGAGSPGKVLLHSNGKKCLQTCVWRENRPKKKKKSFIPSASVENLLFSLFPPFTPERGDPVWAVGKHWPLIWKISWSFIGHTHL